MYWPASYPEKLIYCTAFFEVNSSISAYIDKKGKRHICLYLYSRSREPIQIFQDFFEISKKVTTIQRKDWLLFELRIHKYGEIRKITDILLERLSDYKRTEQGLILHKYENYYFNNGMKAINND